MNFCATHRAQQTALFSETNRVQGTLARAYIDRAPKTPDWVPRKLRFTPHPEEAFLIGRRAVCDSAITIEFRGSSLSRASRFAGIDFEGPATTRAPRRPICKKCASSRISSRRNARSRIRRQRRKSPQRLMRSRSQKSCASNKSWWTNSAASVTRRKLRCRRRKSPKIDE
jgi:hypothetical protein